jgi:hypothetical protein
LIFLAIFLLVYFQKLTNVRDNAQISLPRGRVFLATILLPGQDGLKIFSMF